MNKDKDKQKMMEIEVKFGKGRIARVLVHYGDDPSVLAKEFVLDHKLKPTSVEIIEKYLKSTIDKFLEMSRHDHPEHELDYAKVGTLPSSQSTASDSVAPLLQKSNSEELEHKNKSEESFQINQSTSAKSNLNSERVYSNSHHHEPANHSTIKAITSTDPFKDFFSVNTGNEANHSSSLWNNDTPSNPMHNNGAIVSNQAITSSTDNRSTSHMSPLRQLSTPLVYQKLHHPTNGFLVPRASSFNNLTNVGSMSSSALSIPNIIQNSFSTTINRIKYSNSTKNNSSENPTELAKQKDPLISAIDDPLYDLDHIEFQKNIDRDMNIESFSADQIAHELSHSKTIAGIPYQYHPNTHHLGLFNDFDKSSPTLRVRSQTHPADANGFQMFSSNGQPHYFQSQPSLPKYNEETKMVYNYLTPLQSLSYAENNSGPQMDEVVVTQAVEGNNSIDQFVPDEDLPSSNLEDTYNRLKMQYKLPATSSKGVRNSHSTEKTNQSIPLNDSNYPIRPVSTMLIMSGKTLFNKSNQFTSLSVHNDEDATNQLVGKKTHERLYHTAEMIRRKHERYIKLKDDLLAKEMASNQYKLNKQSNRIVKNLKSTFFSEDVGRRLHEDGIRQRKSRLKSSNAAAKINEIKEWSCAKCGMFHLIPFATLQTNKMNKVMQICSNCSWNQSIVEDFHPVNIGLELSENSDELLRGREGSGETIHDQLFHNAKNRHEILKLNKILWEEAEKELTFTPNISEGSKSIISKYVKSDNTGLDDPEPTTTYRSFSHDLVDQHHSFHDIKPTETASSSQYRSLTPPFRVGQYHRYDNQIRKMSTEPRKKSNNTLSGPAIRNYFQLDPVTRLTQNSSKPRDEDETNKVIPTFPISNPKEDQFFNRLTYEYREKDLKRRLTADKVLSSDPTTGQPLFQPKIPHLVDAHNSSYANVESIYKKKTPNIHEVLLKRGMEAETRKKKIAENVKKSELHDMEKNRVMALDRSKAILKQSREKNIEELFCLLIKSIKENGDNDDIPREIIVPSESIYMNNFQSLPSESSNPTTSFEVDEHKGINRLSEETDTVSSIGGNSNPEKHSSFNRQAADDDMNLLHQQLDLAAIDVDCLIPEVSVLLTQVQNEKLDQIEQELLAGRDHEVGVENLDNADKILVDYKEFRALILKCMKQRDGPGRAYLFAPKKQPDLALKMAADERAQETFRPVIDRNSRKIIESRERYVGHSRIEDVLLQDGEVLRSKIEQARLNQMKKDAKVITFQPDLYPTPGNIIPRYRGMKEAEELEEQLDAQFNDKAASHATVDPPHNMPSHITIPVYKVVVDNDKVTNELNLQNERYHNHHDGQYIEPHSPHGDKSTNNPLIFTDQEGTAISNCEEQSSPQSYFPTMNDLNPPIKVMELPTNRLPTSIPTNTADGSIHALTASHQVLNREGKTQADSSSRNEKQISALRIESQPNGNKIDHDAADMMKKNIHNLRDDDVEVGYGVQYDQQKSQHKESKGMERSDSISAISFDQSGSYITEDIVSNGSQSYNNKEVVNHMMNQFYSKHHKNNINNLSNKSLKSNLHVMKKRQAKMNATFMKTALSNNRQANHSQQTSLPALPIELRNMKLTNHSSDDVDEDDDKTSNTIVKIKINP